MVIHVGCSQTGSMATSFADVIEPTLAACRIVTCHTCKNTPGCKKQQIFAFGKELRAAGGRARQIATKEHQLLRSPPRCIIRTSGIFSTSGSVLGTLLDGPQCEKEGCQKRQKCTSASTHTGVLGLYSVPCLCTRGARPMVPVRLRGRCRGVAPSASNTPMAHRSRFL